MATKGDINATVGIGVKTEAGALKGLNDQLNTVIRQVQATVTGALKETDKMSAANAAKLREFAKALNATENAMKVLQRYSTGNRKILDFLGSDEQLQKQAKSIRNVQEYRRSLEQAGTSTDALKARINELDRVQVQSATKGKKSLDAQIIQQQKLRDALKEYEGVQRKLSNTTLQAGMLSPASQAKLNEFVGRAKQAQDIFTKMAGDRRVFNFEKGLDQLKLATLELDKQIKLLAQQDRQQGAIAEKVKQRARDMLATTPRMEQAQILSAGNKGFSSKLYQDMKPEEFERRIGRATMLYDRAKKQLQAELDKGANADTRRLEALMNRYKALQGILGQTSKAYERLAADIEKARIKAEQQSSAGGNQSKLGSSLKGLLGDGGLALGARVGIYALAANGIYGVMNAARDAARFIIEFEDKLAQLQAISGSTNSQMEELGKNILEVSRNSRFSAVEIAEATIQLAQAGFSADDLKNSLAAVTQFAAASGTSVKESVDLITGAIGAFQLQASEASRITDVFTAALNRSRLTSQQIAQAIQYVGTTAYEQNISLEQMVATIGSVAQAGVRAGSTLGTGFRQFLVDLANPTEKLKDQLKNLGLSMADIDVKTRGLPAVLDSLSKAGFGAAQAYEGLEVRAAAFYLAAKNNVDVTNQLMLAESQRGVAMEASARAMDSLTAQWQRFKNILSDEMSEDMGTITRAMKEVVKSINDYIEARKEEQAESDRWQNERAEYIQSIEGETDRIDSLAEAWEKFRHPGRSQEFDNSMKNAVQTSEELATATAKATDEVVTQSQKIDTLDKELDRLTLQHDTLSQNQVQAIAETATLSSRFAGLAENLGNTANRYDDLIAAMKRYRVQQLQILGQNLGAQESALRGSQEGAAREFASARSRVLGSEQFGRLSRGQQQQLRGLLNSNLSANGGRNAQILSDFAEKLGPGFQGLRTDLRKAFQSISQVNLTQYDINAARRARGEVNANLTPVGQRLNNATRNFNARLGQLSARGAEMDPSGRAALYGGLRNQVEKEIGYQEGVLRRPGITDAERATFSKGIEELKAIRQQIIGAVAPTDKEEKAAERAARTGAAAAKREEAANRRAQNLYERNEVTTAQAKLKAADRTMQAYLSDKPLDGKLSAIPELFQEADDLLDTWVEARNAVKDATIAKGDMNPDQIQDMVEATNDEIAAKTKQTYQQLVSVIDNAITKFIEQQTNSIENEFRAAMENADRTLSLAEGTLSGLNNPLYNIPDFTKVIQQRNVDLAQQANNLARYQANQTRYNSTEEMISSIEEKRTGIQNQIGALDPIADKAKIDKLNEEFSVLGVKIADLTLSNNELKLTNDTLKASIDAQNAKPTTFGEGLAQAATAFGIQNNIGIGLDERMINGLGGAIDAVHSSFQQFFADIVTGSATVGQAFGGMAKAVVAAIGEMAAKAVATQIFGLLLSFIPGFAPGGSSAGASSMSTGGFSLPSLPMGLGRWNGGKIGNETPKRLISGGRVSNGLPTRDSTLVHAAKGEFMMRRSSVESIGESLLSDMNNRGAQALKGLGDKNIVMPQSQLQSSVYVVLPEEKPQLGPNDILAVVSRDVLRGGATKQLIKQVAAGG